MKTNRMTLAAALFAAVTASAGAKEIVLDVIAPTQEREAIVWNVNREITGFRVEVVEGRPIINKAKIVRVEEWPVGAYFSPGQPLEKKWGTPRMAGQVGVNLDNARQTKLRLVVYVADGRAPSSKSKETVLDVIAPTQEREAIVWNVNREITGFRIEVVEGRPIINKVKIVRVEEWPVGAYFSPGQPLEKKWDTPRQAGQIGANLDNARQTKLRLVIYTR